MSSGTQIWRPGEFQTDPETSEPTLPPVSKKVLRKSHTQFEFVFPQEEEDPDRVLTEADLPVIDPSMLPPRPSQEQQEAWADDRPPMLPPNDQRYKLTRSEPTRVQDPHCFRNWAISVECAPAKSGVDPNIFVYHVAPENDPIEQADTFHNVASLAQMQLLPTEEAVNAALEAGEDPFTVAGENGAFNYIPFYRSSKVELTFNNVIAMNRFWKVVRFDAAKLSKEYWDYTRLEETDEETV